MGKKKSKAKAKRNDARGYGQSAAPTTTKPIGKPTSISGHHQAVLKSADAHNELVDLLFRLQQEYKNSSAISNSVEDPWTPSHRFESNLRSSILPLLLQYGFTVEQIQAAAKALGYGLSIESALDYFCLNYPPTELPPIFTEGTVRDAVTQQQRPQDSLEVHVATSPPANVSKERMERSQGDSFLVPSDYVSTKKKEEDADTEEEDQSARKAWLLEQYAYEDDGIDGDHKQEECNAQEMEKDTSDMRPAATENGQEQKDIEEAPTEPMSTQELQLQELLAELQELEADLNNEANNYMRSKQETKQLAGQVKRLKQQVAGVERKVNKERAKRQREEAEAKAKDGDVSDDDGGGLFDLFGGLDDDDDVEGPSIAQVDNHPVDDTEDLPFDTKTDYSIPASWTGTTPQKALEDYLRRQKLPAPAYSVLKPTKGCRLTVRTSKSRISESKLTFEIDSFKFQGDAKAFCATQALYALDPSLQLYTTLPRVFSDLWLSWLRKVQDIKDKERQLQSSEFDQKVDAILEIIATEASTKRKGSETSHGRDKTLTGQPDADTEMGSWDDDMDNADALDSSRKDNISSKKSQQLKNEFLKRQGFSNYKKMLEIRRSLPMFEYRDRALVTIENNPVTILCAETGAGKTTQLPQYLLEEALMGGKGDKTNIICTQPRRVAATSVAERVAEEMCGELGEQVGYQIRMEAKRSARTKLLFCTTGIVLRRLQEDPLLKGTTHVIVDEVHERQQQTDVLLIILRRLLQGSRPDLKVVLMSATLDSKLFCEFFQGAPLVSVPGRTFPVNSYYLEDLIDATNTIIEEGSPYALRKYQRSEKATFEVTGKGREKHREVADLYSQTDVSDVTDLYPGYKMSTRRSMDRVNEERINYDLIIDTLDLLFVNPTRNDTLLPPPGSSLEKGSVLIFLPGLGEIRSLTERLQGSRRTFGDPNKFQIVPMHSTLSSRDQRKALLPARAGCRKIIVSTNIAETSVTIPDVVCVMDCGRMREVRMNKRTSTSTLVTDWCSRASAKQRAGRAGRVQSGICLKLYSSNTERQVMKATSEPELQRVPLEEVCLSILASGLADSCKDFLLEAPQPPSEAALQSALNVLLEVGAIVVPPAPRQTSPERSKERLTPLGQHLAKLPVDVRLGKMLIYGSMFQCLEPILTIAASVSSQSPFATFLDEAHLAKAKHATFQDTESDFLTYCNVYKAFEKAGPNDSSRRAFCNEYFLNFQALREIRDARNHFLDLLSNIGFVDRDPRARANGDASLRASIVNTHGDCLPLVHAIVGAALYPNIAKWTKKPSADYELWHKKERLYFYSSSALAKTPSSAGHGTRWVAFLEKFGTAQRVSVSTACWMPPLAILLFASTKDDNTSSMRIDHIHRRVTLNDWIEMSMAAQTAVILRALNQQVQEILQRRVDQRQQAKTAADSSSEGKIQIMVDGIARLFDLSS